MGTVEIGPETARMFPKPDSFPNPLSDERFFFRPLCLLDSWSSPPDLHRCEIQTRQQDLHHLLTLMYRI